MDFVPSKSTKKERRLQLNLHAKFVIFETRERKIVTSLKNMLQYFWTIFGFTAHPVARDWNGTNA